MLDLSLPLPTSLALLLAASLLDFFIGDPWGVPHPVHVMGWAIARYTNMAFAVTKSPTVLRYLGVMLALGMILGSGFAGWAIASLAARLHPWLGFIAASVLLATCFAARSLRNAATEVLEPLLVEDLVTARSRLVPYVGRDTEQLSEPELLRAVIETVTENAVDAVTAPLFYAIVGALFAPTLAPSFALGYKAASTLDSTVGYKTPPYKDIGWFSARLEDHLTWLPCRLTILTLALLSGKPRYVWRMCQRDAPKDPSPNAGWSECTYAAILGVQMGGTNTYRGVVKQKPLLGDRIYPITPAKIHEALQLTRICLLIWLGIGAIALTIFG